MNVLSTVKLSHTIKEQLANDFPSITFYHDQKIDEADQLLPKADIILTYGEDLLEDHISAATNLNWIMVASAGIEKLPFDILKQRQISVTNAKGVHAIPMAEYCLSMMLQVYRQAKVLIENEKQHNWDRRVKMEELYGKTVYILGTGAIGTATAKLSKAFGMKVLGMNSDGRSIEYFDQTFQKEEILLPLTEADFVISVLPSTNDTKSLINKEFIHKMKEEAVFINIGRGDVIVEEDLITALKNNKLKHAVLDVFEEEPLGKQHIFWELDNVTVTPHLSGITDLYLPRAMEIFQKNLHHYLANEFTSMDNKINLDQRY
ncbi:D-2-hydroxyacid dehydrogenase [Metabacillus litoralis]|uniref:D-2-hydroxyacid dehydrogenase n=1 Tax=Metabacillus litoralis TaxID=152268 RepID=UPI001CFEB6EE|nr:D-2-hydroxyacid dehydrogenase [Metabacillus litoralis]